MSGPLSGLRVVECAGYLSAPTAGAMLADMGAEVIKVEDRERGDPTRGTSALFGASMTLPNGENVLFETANRAKKGITLDLKKARGRELLYELVRGADVFLTNFTQSTLRKLKIDYESLREVNPRLVYGLATGYGLKGPEATKRAFDSVAQARSSIMYALGGEPGTPPAQIGGPVFDQLTGTLLVNGVLAALLQRERGGSGQQVEVSLLGAGIHLQAFNINTALLRGRQIPRPARQQMRNPMANHYECADGEWLLLSEPQADRYWPAFCDAIDRADLVQDPRFSDTAKRRDNYAQMNALLDEVFKKRSRVEWIERFEAKGQGIAYSPVLRPTDLADDAQALANGYVQALEHPGIGPVKMVGSPLSFGSTPLRVEAGAPQFGQHTEEVLLEVCGYDWDRIQQLKDEQVV
ncbi:MAG TPA: CoA transferase [Rubrivivax sp.]|jgi:crotonobetainyl-CoA:carnitine CoA-transferase CaiB-like acyl-CoA transferase|nr:CoA transferase [Burkholderiaceae bacterium]HMR70138.1 CoA transferase [Rubrivivax sp.]